jgi:lysophospholipase L1-like esterase
MSKLILLGDSTLDNKRYTGGKPSVSEYLQEYTAPAWEVLLLAQDGDCMCDVYTRLKRLPEDATHMLLSVGGNDALSHRYILENDSGNYPSVLDELFAIYAGFGTEYRDLVRTLRGYSLPLILTMIYEGDFGDEVMQKRANTALAGFNDIIIRTAVREELPVIDLREVCRKPEHFTSRIEPSVEGGERFARMIGFVLEHHDFTKGGTRVYG